MILRSEEGTAGQPNAQASLSSIQSSPMKSHFDFKLCGGGSSAYCMLLVCQEALAVQPDVKASPLSTQSSPMNEVTV